MVRAFLSIITIIHHPSSIIFGMASIGQKETIRRLLLLLLLSGIGAFCARPFFFSHFWHFSALFFFFLFLCNWFQFLVLVFAQSQPDRISDVVSFFHFLYDNTLSVMEFWFDFRLFLHLSIWVGGLLNAVSTLRPCLHGRWTDGRMNGWGFWRLLGGLAWVDVGKYSRDSVYSAVNSSVSGLVCPGPIYYTRIWSGYGYTSEGVCSVCFSVLFSLDFSVALAF